MVVALAAFAACSPQKRLNRLVKKHPELIRVDTIRDTATTPAVHVDTLFHYKTGDTVIIEKENIRTELVFLPGDTVKVTTDKAPDTVYFEKHVPFIQPVYTDSKELQKQAETIAELKRYFWPVCSLMFIAGFITAAFIFRKK